MINRPDAVHTNSRQYHTDSSSDSSSDSDSDTESDIDSEDDSFMPHIQQPTSSDFSCTMESRDTDINWQKPILLRGKPGSGKSEAICHSVIKNLANQENILVAAPTGFLSSRFRAILPDEVTCDTVHSVFHIPVNTLGIFVPKNACSKCRTFFQNRAVFCGAW
jgi:primosomal protein N'